MITIKDLHFKYGRNGAELFGGLNLELQENRIYGLLGKNGVGKSTLLNLVCGLQRADKGSVEFSGIDVKERQPEVLAESYIVPEEFDMPKLSLSQYKQKHRDFYPNFSEEVLNRCLTDFELPTDVNLRKLSMGQKKKVVMSFALAAGTKLLLMDEPTNGLDIPSKSLFRKVVANNMDDGRILVISTHQVHDVESLLDHIIILSNSGLELDMSVAELTEKYDFTYRQPSAVADAGVLYAEPSLQGSAVMTRHKAGDAETTLNLELLFNAVTKGALQ